VLAVDAELAVRDRHLDRGVAVQAAVGRIVPGVNVMMS
jgi:hypothetical protein